MEKILFKKESYDIIGAAMEVHSELGPGFLEPIYQEALEIEFQNKKIAFERESRLFVFYKGTQLNKEYIADFICYNQIIIEIKAVSELTTEHQSQLINYLKATNKKLGILINFGAPSLEYKRMVL